MHVICKNKFKIMHYMQNICLYVFNIYDKCKLLIYYFLEKNVLYKYKIALASITIHSK